MEEGDPEMIADSYYIKSTNKNIIESFMSLSKKMVPGTQYNVTIGRIFKKTNVIDKTNVEEWIHFYRTVPYYALHINEKLILRDRMLIANEIWKKVNKKKYI